jgi:hypothetical protein
MNEFRVAIPTYNRPELIQKAALAYLERSQFPIEQVDIWISGQSQWSLYDDLPDHWRKRFKLGVKGLSPNRYAAEDTYPPGMQLFWMNDDIFSIRELAADGKHLGEVPLQQVLSAGFSACVKAGAHLWGIYAVDNHFYMSRKVHIDLRYVVGCAYGIILQHHEHLRSRFGDAKEDYERALRFYQADGCIVRLDYFSPKTIYYNSPEIFPNTETVEQNIRELERNWPAWVHRNTRKRSPFPEINIKDPVKPRSANHVR